MHDAIIGGRRDGVNDMHPTIPATPCRSRARSRGASDGSAGSVRLVDVRIGVTQAPREINIELADDADRDDLKARIEAALAGATDVLVVVDKRGNESFVPASKIAYVELGSQEGSRSIGFGG